MFLPFLPVTITVAGMQDPTSSAMKFLGVFPLTSPTALSARLVLTDVAAWEALVALLLLLVTIWLRKTAARIFRLAMLMYGKELVVEGATLGGDGTDRDRFIQNIKDTPMESPPGTNYRYTNAGYSVLAAIIERVSQQPYETFVREQLLNPAGMTNTGFRGDFARTDVRVARGYLGTPERIEEGPPLPYLWGTRGAGGIVATVGDVYKWLLAVQGDRILSAQAKKKTFAPSPTEQYCLSNSVAQFETLKELRQ